MQAQTQLATRELEQPADHMPQWNRTKRIAFRFACVYLTLYCLPFPLDYNIPYVGYYVFRAYNELWFTVVPWVGKHILRLSYEMPINRTGGGSGDTTFAYTQVLCFLTLAAVATLVWSLLDRKRAAYTKLDQWLRLYVRLWLGHYLIIYGAMKFIPTQMSPPMLMKLVQPYGDSTKMGVLWDLMGTSLAYQSITGGVELLGGILLIIPRTALLGALVSLVAMTQVFLLNMCYDVPVKLFSFHLVFASVFLLAPYVRRLADVVVFNRTAEPAQAVPFFRRRWLNWGLIALQIVYGGYLTYAQLNAYYQGYYYYGKGAPKPPLYGIWNVEEFTVNGEVKPPLLTDESRWLRLIIDRQFSLVHSMKGAYMPFGVQVDHENNKLTLNSRNGKFEMNMEEVEPGRLVVTGDVEGKRIQAKLVRYDESKFFLNSRGFSWIQERPVNR